MRNNVSLRLFPAVLWILFIWGHSLLPGAVSSIESQTFLHILQGGFSMLQLTEHILRKTAHFGEYAILALLLIPAIHTLGKDRRTFFFQSLSAALAVPLIDETIQLFIVNRSGKVSDIWIDLAGFAAGACILLCIHILSRRHTTYSAACKRLDRRHLLE